MGYDRRSTLKSQDCWWCIRSSFLPFSSCMMDMAWLFLLLCFLVIDGAASTDRAPNYLQALNTTSSAVCEKLIIIPTTITTRMPYWQSLFSILKEDKIKISKMPTPSLNTSYSAGVDTSFGGLFGAPTLTGG